MSIYVVKGLIIDALKSYSDSKKAIFIANYLKNVVESRGI
jgi:hypothetical protein